MLQVERHLQLQRGFMCWQSDRRWIAVWGGVYVGTKIYKGYLMPALNKTFVSSVKGEPFKRNPNRNIGLCELCAKSHNVPLGKCFFEVFLVLQCFLLSYKSTFNSQNNYSFYEIYFLCRKVVPIKAIPAVHGAKITLERHIANIHVIFQYGNHYHNRKNTPIHLHCWNRSRNLTDIHLKTWREKNKTDCVNITYCEW